MDSQLHIVTDAVYTYIKNKCGKLFHSSECGITGFNVALNVRFCLQIAMFGLRNKEKTT